MSEELNEPTPVDNSTESTVDVTNDPNTSDNQTFDVGDPRFKSKEDLYNSYKELESKLGNRKDVEKKAQLADGRIKALAAEKNISFDEAEQMLETETNDLLRKHRDTIISRETSEELRKTNLRMDRRDLLDDYPESKEVVDRVVDLALRTGESPRKIYERDFKPLIDRTMDTPSNTNRPVRRATDPDERPDNQEKLYQERFDAARKAKPRDFNEALEKALRAKHFGV